MKSFNVIKSNEQEVLTDITGTDVTRTDITGVDIAGKDIVETEATESNTTQIAVSWYDRQEKRGFRPAGLIGYTLILLMLGSLFLFPNLMNKGTLSNALMLVLELIFAVFAILPAIAARMDLKKVFRIRRPKLNEVIAVPFFWLGFLICNIGISGITRYYFPDAFYQTTLSSYQTYASVSPWLMLLITVPAAGICEEMMFRGLIFHSFGNRRNKWLVILITGILFGAMHLTPVNFVSLSLLGVLLTLIMAETGNLLLPILLHMLNNAVSMVITYQTLGSVKSSGGTVSLESLIPGNLTSMQTFGLLITGLFGIPILMLAGRLLHVGRSEQLKNYRRRNRKVGLVILLMGIIITAGFGIITGGAQKLIDNSAASFVAADEIILDYHMVIPVDLDTKDVKIPLIIKTDGTFLFDYELINERGIVDFTLTDKQGKIYNNMSAGSMTISGQKMVLKAGDYEIIMHFMITEDAVREYWKAKQIDFTEDTIQKLNVIDTDAKESMPVTISIKVYR